MFRGPVRRSRGGFVLRLSDDEVTILRRLLGELGDLLRGEGDPALAARLFPPAHPDDPELEEEYQRLMRSELVESRLEALRSVDEVLTSGERLDEPQLTAFMQSINSIRLVLGTMLDISDDPERPEIEPALEASPEHQLYTYLSWLLEWTVTALSGAS